MTNLWQEKKIQSRDLVTNAYLLESYQSDFLEIFETEYHNTEALCYLINMIQQHPPALKYFWLELKGQNWLLKHYGGSFYQLRIIFLGVANRISVSFDALLEKTLNETNDELILNEIFRIISTFCASHQHHSLSYEWFNLILKHFIESFTVLIPRQNIISFIQTEKLELELKQYQKSAIHCLPFFINDDCKTILIGEKNQWFPLLIFIYCQLFPESGSFSKVDMEEMSAYSNRSVLLSILTFFISICQNYLQFRNDFLNELLPADMDRSEALHEGKHIYNRWIRTLTAEGAQDAEFQQLVTEFLYLICNEDPKLFIQKVGFGSAAGLLAKRNLFNPEMLAQNSNNNLPSNIDPITGKIREDKNEIEMTEEEKEAEAKKLFELFDKLEKQGVIQVVRNNQTVS